MVSSIRETIHAGLFIQLVELGFGAPHYSREQTGCQIRNQYLGIAAGRVPGVIETQALNRLSCKYPEVPGLFRL